MQFLPFRSALRDIQRHEELFEVKEAVPIIVKDPEDVVAKCFGLADRKYLLEQRVEMLLGQLPGWTLFSEMVEPPLDGLLRKVGVFLTEYQVLFGESLA